MKAEELKTGVIQKKEKNQIPKVRTLGPIANLEDHVKPDWWRHIFNAHYLKTDGDVVCDQTITKKEIDTYAQILSLKKEQRILDLCCGQGRHCLQLARSGMMNVEGLDRSHYLVQKAKNQARREMLDIKFREGDARKLPYPESSFDVVTILGNSFGYFETVNDDLRVLKEVFRVLKAWGKVLIDVSDGEYIGNNFTPRSWEWIDRNYFVCRERSLSLDRQRLISREVITHAEKGVVADQFYAERLYTQENLLKLLQHAGFSAVTAHGEVVTDTARNQDLGMMERRIIVTAEVRKEVKPPVVRTRQAARKVTVIFGDPTKNDLLKPSQVFDDDDFYTIDQLKLALQEDKRFQFSFINGHNTMINDLVRNRANIDFVFNLCDEGFYNDPRKELHVPAILEMLGIPYTGSGPQCLAFCYDKSLIRGISREMGIPVPQAFFIKPEDNVYELSFAFPVIVKPNCGDSSFGITQRSVARNIEELVTVIEEVREILGREQPILVEEFLEGKDLSIGIIGNPPETMLILPIIEEDYSMLPKELPRLCGYEAKWMPDSPYWKIRSIPARLPLHTEKLIEECSLKLLERLDCRDYTRFDWRLDREGMPRLLEVNPNPGWCWDGHMAKMAKIKGMTYADMLREIMTAAEQRIFGSGGQ